ncbi:hypothetical protein ACO0LO_04060 [Undibacterium sp. TJN25]|uniref:hypothetical protein n=1 Tax=Undibacterium sp. TJN25 TaxID=3413056 RepID=UPI003BF1A323
MNVQQPGRVVGLSDLLTAVPLIKVQSALTTMLGARWGVVDMAGMVLLGKGARPRHDTMALPLYLETSVVGKLSVNGGRREQLISAANWLCIVLADAQRYLLVAGSHKEPVGAGAQNVPLSLQTLQDLELRNRELTARLAHAEAQLLHFRQMQDVVLALRRGQVAHAEQLSQHAGIGLAVREFLASADEAGGTDDVSVNPES